MRITCWNGNKLTRVGSEEGARVHGRPRGRRRERRAVQGAGGPGLVLALNLLQA